MKQPYIGITGFSRLDEVSAALRVFPDNSNRKLMISILATHKSLRGIPMKPKWAKQTPNPSAIAGLFPNDKRVVNLVHFSTEKGQENLVLADMLKIHELAGPNFHGFQLNVAWPQINQLDDYRVAMGWDFRIVLQIGRKAMEAVSGTAQGMVDKLCHYTSLIDDVLLDPSGGLGKPFDTERARELLTAIRDKGWNLGIGVAGSLGPDSLGLVEPLLAEFPDLSIDAQGRLRDSENNLDLNAVKAYLGKALQMFKQL